MQRKKVGRKEHNIIIWGAGNTAKEALQYLSEDVRVLGFFDNNQEIKEFEGLRALDLNKVNDYEFEYIVICSIYHGEISQQLERMGISSEKILVYDYQKISYYGIYQVKPFETKWKRLKLQDKPEIFISGISYHGNGIDEQIFEFEMGKKAFNFAMRSQDIFYDYHIAQFLDVNGYLENVTHYIIGLSYYSFEYDLSKTHGAWQIIRYYPYIRTAHNMLPDDLFEAFVLEKRREIEANKLLYSLFAEEEKYTLDIEEGRKFAKMDFNKNNPITVWENKENLKRYITFLTSRNIKPIIVIMPALESYVENCPMDFKNRFYKALGEVIGGMDIQVLDYFGNYDEEESDYYHVSHFNEKGAKKFTKKLIEDIRW